MIYISKLQSGNSIVKLKTSDLFEKKDSLQELINSLNVDLNHNLEDGLGFKFNSLGENDEENFPEYFVRFIQNNINLAKSYRGTFLPFLPEEVNENVDKYIRITGNSIKKLKDFVIDSSFLRTPFLIDYLDYYLSSTIGITDYLIEFENYFCANGKKEWVIAHEDIPGTYGIQNESVIIEDYSVAPIKKFDLKSSKIIITSESSCINKIESLLFPELHNDLEFQEYSERNHLDFIIIDEDKVLHQFP